MKCPKCEGEFSPPRYCDNPYWCKFFDPREEDHLHYHCLICTYTIKLPCKDKKK